MMGKVVFLRISILLIVWLPLAVVAVINKRDDSIKLVILENKMKTISTICSTTDYQKECQNILVNIAHNTSSNDPKEYIKAAILATDKQIKKCYNMTKMSSRSSCTELFNMASHSLWDSYSRVEEPDMHTNGGKIGDIRAWLSAVISLTESCRDSLEQVDLPLKQKVDHDLDIAEKLAGNSIAIFDAVIELPNKHDLQVKVQSRGRRLLGTTDQVGSD